MDDEVSSVLVYVANNPSVFSGWVEKRPIDNKWNLRWNRKYLVLYPHLIVWYREPQGVMYGSTS